EDQVVHPAVLDDESEAIEVLDAGVELPAVEQVDADRQLLAARVVEEDVLDVRRTGFGFRHERKVPRRSTTQFGQPRKDLGLDVRRLTGAVEPPKVRLFAEPDQLPPRVAAVLPHDQFTRRLQVPDPVE